jgi:thioredoxin-related protein
MKISKSTKKILKYLLIAAIILCVLCCLLCFINDTREGAVAGRQELLLMHMNGCGHCVKLMPEWKKFTKLNKTSITTKAVETADDPSLAKKYGVEGYPTILLLGPDGKKKKTYNGDRTAQGLLDFCQQNS